MAWVVVPHAARFLARRAAWNASEVISSSGVVMAVTPVSLGLGLVVFFAEAAELAVNRAGALHNIVPVTPGGGVTDKAGVHPEFLGIVDESEFGALAELCGAGPDEA